MKNVCHQKMYMPTFCWSMIWWWSSSVPTDLPSKNKLVSTNQWANESYSRSSFIGSKLTESRCNEQEARRSNEVFSRERRLEKRKWIHPTHHTSLRIVTDSSVLLDFFSFVSKCLSCNRQNSWGELKRIGI